MMSKRAQMGLMTAAFAGCLLAATGAEAQGKAPANTAPKNDAARDTSALVCPGAGVEGLRDEAGRLFQMADTDHDGRLSKQEALGAANFIVGGFFFRADTNNDGTVTPKEAKEARREFLARQPMLSVLLKGVRSAGGKSPFEGVARMLDIEYGKPLKAAEAREAVRKAVDATFAYADDNKDNTLTMAEARGAAAESAAMLGKLAFGAADANNDGMLNLKEFESAVLVPARAAFAMSDANDDGKLSPDEARTALSGMMNQLGVRFLVVEKTGEQNPKTGAQPAPKR